MSAPDTLDASARAMARCLAEGCAASKVVRIPPEYAGEGGAPVDLLVVATMTEAFEARRERVLRLCAEVDSDVRVDALVLTPEEVEYRLRRGDGILEELLRYGDTLYAAPERDGT